MLKTVTGYDWLVKVNDRAQLHLQSANEGRLFLVSLWWVENPGKGEKPINALLGALQTQMDVVSGVRYLVHQFDWKQNPIVLIDTSRDEPVAFANGLNRLKSIVQHHLEEQVRFFHAEGNEGAADDYEAVRKRFNEHIEALLKAHAHNPELNGFDPDIWKAAFENI